MTPVFVITYLAAGVSHMVLCCLAHHRLREDVPLSIYPVILLAWPVLVPAVFLVWLLDRWGNE